MKIELETNDYNRVYRPVKARKYENDSWMGAWNVYEVPDETAERWLTAYEAWEKVEQEMNVFAGRHASVGALSKVAELDAEAERE